MAVRPPNPDLNEAASRAFGQVARYTHMPISGLIQEATGATKEELEEAEGQDAVVIVEASILEQLATQLRCSVGTLGGGWGAAARCAPLVDCCSEKISRGASCLMCGP